MPGHEYPTGPVFEVLGLAIWHERRLVWTFGGVGNHFYYGVEGLQSTEILHQKPDFCLRFAPNRIISILDRRLSLVLW